MSPCTPEGVSEDSTGSTAGEGHRDVVPKWMVAIIVAVLTILLAVDMLGQFIVPGHAANPILDGGLLTILGTVIAASRGPKPDPDPAKPEPEPERVERPRMDSAPQVEQTDPGIRRRHRRPREDDWR